MIHIERATRVDAPADRVFAAFHEREGRLALGRGYVSDIGVAGQGVGQLISVYTEGHLGTGCVVERTEFFDPDNFEMRLVVIDSGGILPAADYTARVRVFRDGPDACVVAIQTNFIPVDMDEEAALALIEPNYAMLIANLHQTFPGPMDNKEG